jgi:hypothetical protein
MAGIVATFRAFLKTAEGARTPQPSSTTRDHMPPNALFDRSHRPEFATKVALAAAVLTLSLFSPVRAQFEPLAFGVCKNLKTTLID